MADGASNSGLMNIGPTTRRQGVTAAIKQAIVIGDLKPGQKLTEASLSTSLGVSRPTVREALNQLNQEGLLVQEPYRGLRVTALDAEAIADIAEARLAIDLQAVRAIIADDSHVRLHSLEQAWSAYELTAFSDDPVVLHEAHVEFHRKMWVASENYLFKRLWPVTEAHLTIALAQDQSARPDPHRAHHTHLRIMEAVRNGDIAAAHDALYAHTIESAQALVDSDSED
jgi:DNA-binding GntR family transcriptional regulator